MYLRRCIAIAFLGLSSMCARSEEIRFEKIPRPTYAQSSQRVLQALAHEEQRQRRLLSECKKQVYDWKKTDPKTSLGLFFHLSYEVIWKGDRFYTMASLLNINCAGPHEGFSERLLNFDLVTGFKYDPLRLYRLIKRSKRYPEGMIKPEVREMIREELLKARGSAQEDQSCIDVLKGDDIKFFDDDPVALTEAGLRIVYRGPRVVQACYELVVIPYGRLRRFLDPREARRIGWNR